MALPALIVAAIARIRAANNNAYDATSNPAGLGQGGHRQNLVPDLNAVADIGVFAGECVDKADADVALTHADVALTHQDASNTALDRIATAQSVLDAAGKVGLAAAEADRAKAQADLAKAFATGLKLPAVSPDMAGRFLKVNADGTAYELGLITIASSAEAIAGTGNGLMTAALTKAAISAQGFSVGDYLRSEGNPGAKWLPATDAVYSQSAYPALFALLGTRPNGLAVWSGQYVGEASTTTEIVFGGGYFLYLVGNSVYRTTDGISFSKMPGFSSYLSSAECGAYGNGKFCIGGQNQYLLSPDGNGLTYNMSQVPGATGYPRAIGFGEGRFASITSAQDICYSDAVNNTNWTRKTGFGGSNVPCWIAYGNGVWVFLFQSGGCYRCTDIVNNPVSYVSALSNMIGSDFADMIFAGGLFVVTTNGGKMATSPDGLVWTEVTNPNPGNALNQIAYLDGLWCVQSGGLLYRTRDFKSWLKPVPFNVGGSPRCLAAGNGIVVAGATGGSVSWSAAYTYNRSTQFALFEVTNHYIKALP